MSPLGENIVTVSFVVDVIQLCASSAQSLLAGLALTMASGFTADVAL